MVRTLSEYDVLWKVNGLRPQEFGLSTRFSTFEGELRIILSSLVYMRPLKGIFRSATQIMHTHSDERGKVNAASSLSYYRWERMSR